MFTSRRYRSLPPRVAKPSASIARQRPSPSSRPVSMAGCIRVGGMQPAWSHGNANKHGSGKPIISIWVASDGDSCEIHLSVSRALPSGSIALTHARIITLKDKQVIDSGTIVAKAGRITCVGECSTAGVSQVIDAQGKTIIPGWVDMHAHHHRESGGITPTHNVRAGHLPRLRC